MIVKIKGFEIYVESLYVETKIDHFLSTKLKQSISVKSQIGHLYLDTLCAMGCPYSFMPIS